MDNKRTKRTLEFEYADALMMAHAMMIAANTVLMWNSVDKDFDLITLFMETTLLDRP